MRLTSLLFIVLLFASCQSHYEKVEKEELASGKVSNELFLGLELGMPKKEFFGTCWELNSQGILNNGPTELSVEYKPEMPSRNPVYMRFYPKFENDGLYFMPIEFTYQGWSPMNEELTVEKLREDVVALFESWYGPGFFEVSNEDKSLIAFVKIDGNRRIRVFKKSISAVRAEIVDLRVQKQVEENPS